MRKYQVEIRERVRTRGIQFLLHFTLADNLPGIARRGLLSRRDAEADPHIMAYLPSEHRLDGRDDAISLSVSALSPTMFKHKRRGQGDAAWVVLFVCPSVLWTHGCLFCWGNAATNQMRDHRGFRGGPYAFDCMFADAMMPDGAGITFRNGWGIPDDVPSNPDAEVQVLGPVAQDRVIAAWTDRSDVVECYQRDLLALVGTWERLWVESFDRLFWPCRSDSSS